jgi:hypothetical protein
MHYFTPIFRNTIGQTFLIRDCIKTLTGLEKIQLLVGDVAIMLEEKQLASLLKTIISAKNGCLREDCLEERLSKSIKFDTYYTTVFFKSNETNLFQLEALLRGTIFELEFNAILSFNKILE